jgi:hypothetical protein
MLPVGNAQPHNMQTKQHPLRRWIRENIGSEQTVFHELATRLPRVHVRFMFSQSALHDPAKQKPPDPCDPAASNAAP